MSPGKVNPRAYGRIPEHGGQAETDINRTVSGHDSITTPSESQLATPYQRIRPGAYAPPKGAAAGIAVNIVTGEQRERRQVAD